MPAPVRVPAPTIPPSYKPELERTPWLEPIAGKPTLAITLDHQGNGHVAYDGRVIAMCFGRGYDVALYDLRTGGLPSFHACDGALIAAIEQLITHGGK